MRKSLKGRKKEVSVERPLSLNTRLFWFIIAALALIDAIGLNIEGISVVPASLWDMVWRITALLLLSLFYAWSRPDIRLATLMHAVAMFAAVTTPLCIFYYLATTLHQPLVDASLVAADHALGLDWLAAYKRVAACPPLREALSIAYYSLLPQAIVLIFALNFLGVTGRCWELPWLLLVAAIILIPFSLFWPAAGAFGYFHVNESEPYVQIFMGLYNGTLKTVDFQTMQGVVQFPSLHAASAILIAYAARGTRWLFPFFLLLDILMFLATPPLGGHYFADVWGGIALALVTILIVRRWCGSLMSLTIAVEQKSPA